MSSSQVAIWVCAWVGVLASPLAAIQIDTVLVGDQGNVGELSGQSAGGSGQDRVCGAVSYKYRIGKYEVTVGQYTAFLNAVGGVDTNSLYDTDMADSSYPCGITRSGEGTTARPYTYSAAADFVNRPVTYVSYWSACRFANWMHNGQPTGVQTMSTTENGAYSLYGYTGSFGDSIQRNRYWKWAITSEDEWYKAAYYKGGSKDAGYWDFPTCSNNVPGRDLNDGSGNNANAYGTPYPIDSPYYTTKVGEFQNSESPYGTFDQGGNVEEWTESVMPASSPSFGSNRGLRGSSAYTYGHTTMKAAWRRSYYPSQGYFLTGFRVVQAPEPTTMVMLALVSVGVLRRRRA